MLTADLLRVRWSKGDLKPQYISPSDPKLQARAQELIDVYNEGVGQPRGDLDTLVQGVIGDSRDAKLWKGVAKLVEDRAEFGTECSVDPAEVRRRVFLRARARGPLSTLPLTPEEEASGDFAPTPARIYAEVAAELGVDPALLPEALYADLPSAQRLLSVDVPSPLWLLQRYNVALVQAVLYGCESVAIHLDDTSPARLRQLLRAVKFHQLIHVARRTPEGFTLSLDGPASLFSQTTRYGLALARFFPALLLMEGKWEMDGYVHGSGRKGNLHVSHEDGLVSHYRDLGSYDTQAHTFFQERFPAAASGWALDRTPAVLDQGGEGVVVPDYRLQKDGRTAWVEILGFWRRGSLEKRLKLLKKHGPHNLILAVSRRMCAEEASELPDAVVPFAEVIPVKEVIKRAELLAR